MKLLFVNIFSLLFITACEQKTDINSWPLDLDEVFMASCTNTSNQNTKYCKCVLNRIKSDNFDLSIINFDKLLSDNEILQNTLNECVE